ncbi:hypothetical protein ASPBRDRAFT_32323 [Aspergillus brasiliensis CBS 101740]|uniref:Uncharacterized protein n=1 Tax=Aspergillus brasiliensis (strain CBS 101740 / IMI 381727 / IBT 21946) TaxID=767769 RepID=A0A1L9UCT4_ASPBC|nr:hypothetical protein ASPBRDRAFT_32323 [Aspergillus brasiliensis CBS 101740]
MIIVLTNSCTCMQQLITITLVIAIVDYLVSFTSYGYRIEICDWLASKMLHYFILSLHLVNPFIKLFPRQTVIALSPPLRSSPLTPNSGNSGGWQGLALNEVNSNPACILAYYVDTTCALYPSKYQVSGG